VETGHCLPSRVHCVRSRQGAESVCGRRPTSDQPPQGQEASMSSTGRWLGPGGVRSLVLPEFASLVVVAGDSCFRLRRVPHVSRDRRHRRSISPQPARHPLPRPTTQRRGPSTLRRPFSRAADCGLGRRTQRRSPHGRRTEPKPRRQASRTRAPAATCAVGRTDEEGFGVPPGKRVIQPVPVDPRPGQTASCHVQARRSPTSIELAPNRTPSQP
jgi:hypothetical protein